MKKEMVFNQYTGGEESLKFWDRVVMTTLENLYFWNEEEFRKWAFEDEMPFDQLVVEANRWGIQYSEEKKRFYLPKGSTLVSKYYVNQKMLDVEFYHNDDFIDNIDSTEDIRVEFETEVKKVRVVIKAVKEIEINANSDEQAIAIAEQMQENGEIEIEYDDYDYPEFEVLN